jgi:hypothetical protein
MVTGPSDESRLLPTPIKFKKPPKINTINQKLDLIERQAHMRQQRMHSRQQIQTTSGPVKAIMFSPHINNCNSTQYMV